MKITPISRPRRFINRALRYIKSLCYTRVRVLELGRRSHTLELCRGGQDTVEVLKPKFTFMRTKLAARAIAAFRTYPPHKLSEFFITKAGTLSPTTQDSRSSV